MPFAPSNEKNDFPYGTAEHFGYEVRKNFGLEAGMWTVLFCFRERSVAHFLAVVLEKFGINFAQFCAMYLDNFEELPKVMDKTREEIILSKLDFNESEDPDLRRWNDGAF